MVLLAGFRAVSHAGEPATLERVVVVMRHGVRPPTKGADALASLGDSPWPSEAQWGAAPGDLTPHGAAAIRLLGADLRRRYAGAGLLPAAGSLAAKVFLWADSADQRTRETARALGQGLSPEEPVPYASRPAGERDPLFDALAAGVCKLSPAEAEAALSARRPFDTPATRAALDRLQTILAPQACGGGTGTCLEGEEAVSADARSVKLSGPLATASTVAEDLLLEYENGLPMDRVGWGRMRREDLDLVLAAHARTSDLARRTAYVAERRGSTLARRVMALLADRPVREDGWPDLSQRRLVVLVGHDTNLSNLAGVLGVDWRLPGQPDETAPGAMLVFERWREPSGPVVRLAVLYQDAEQVRGLADRPAHRVDLHAGACGPGDCRLTDLAGRLSKTLAAACPDPDRAP